MILQMKFNGLDKYVDKIDDCTEVDEKGFVHYTRNGESLSQTGFEECYLLNDNGKTIKKLAQTIGLFVKNRSSSFVANDGELIITGEVKEGTLKANSNEINKSIRDYEERQKRNSKRIFS